MFPFFFNGGGKLRRLSDSIEFSNPGFLIQPVEVITSSMKNVSKRIFLESLNCRTKGWFLRSQIYQEPPSEAECFLFEQGSDIGRRARMRYPDGILVGNPNIAEAINLTQRSMADENISVLFEAAFQWNDFVARADILVRLPDGWHILEVKSSLEDSEELEKHHVDDLAYTVGVARKCGTSVSKASLLLISSEYRKGDDVDRLFMEVDYTGGVNERLSTFEPIWSEIQEKTDGSRPEPTLIGACRKCEFFASHCLGNGIENPITELYGIRSEKIQLLGQSNILRIEEVPDDFDLTDVQAIAVECIKQDKTHVGESLHDELEEVVWPAYYLDFETVMTAVPLYPDIKPHEQVLTQYSIHKCSAPGEIVGHTEFLAEVDRDCRRELAEKMLDELGEEGSVLVYSSFEKTHIRTLQKMFPDLGTRLGQIVDRLFDLLPVIRRSYYHPDLHGSYSIKHVLPVLVPGMSYDDLSIGDGLSASTKFARMAWGQFSPEEVKQTRSNLLNYCKRDTLAMVRLHEQFLNLT